MAWTQGATGPTVVTLPFEPVSVRRVRRLFTDELAEHDVDEDRREEAVLVVSELVGNALRHARPTPGGGGLEVAWTVREHEVEVAVTDGGGSTRPRVLHPPASSPGGRGLEIVSELAIRWGVHPDGGGSSVYAVLSLDDGPPP